MTSSLPRLLLRAAVAAALPAACAHGTSPSPSAVQVTADVFSGRPNPAWTLDAREARELAGLIAALRPLAGPAETYDGLGYRGMVVAGGVPGLEGCGELRVRDGRAAARCSGGGRYFGDEGRALERWLVESASERVDAGTYALLRAAVGP